MLLHKSYINMAIAMLVSQKRRFYDLPEPKYEILRNLGLAPGRGRGGFNDIRVDTMITKREFGKSDRTHHPPPT